MATNGYGSGERTTPRRVVITGIGAITPIGSGKEGLWAGVRRSRSAIQRITRFDASEFRAQIAGQVNDFDPGDYIDPRQARRYDRYSQFAVAAARMAMQDAKLESGGFAPEQAGTYLGSALGGLAFAEEQHVNYMGKGIRGVDPILALTVFGAAASCNVSMQLGLNGPNTTNANSCASGAVAIGHSFELIRSGGARVMVAGGIEAPLAPLIFGAFDHIRALSTNNDDPAHASRPFDRCRDGFVMSEGAAILVLEDLEHALDRGAPIYAEIIGFATTTDAYHMTAPLPSGAQARRCMREALAYAGLEPQQIDYINAHGSATPLNDKTESAAIRAVFGPDADTTPISGTKGMHGHALGASGAFEAAISALCMDRGWLPPSINIENPDPECDLPYIGGDGLELRVQHILSNSFGFGGVNAALIFSRYRD